MGGRPLSVPECPGREECTKAHVTLNVFVSSDLSWVFGVCLPDAKSHAVRTEELRPRFRVPAPALLLPEALPSLGPDSWGCSLQVPTGW